MFRLFRIERSETIEVFPAKGIYTVQELNEYEFFYDGDVPNLIFLEDIPIDARLYTRRQNSIVSKKFRFFQDYFGYASLRIGVDVFRINIQIEKLKVSEIEAILIFLWKNENQIFNNFLSKSSIKSEIDKNGSEFGITSKYLVFVNHFYETFKNLLSQFQSFPHYVLRSSKTEVPYSHMVTSPESVNWIFANLDKVKFDNSFENHPDAILLGNNYGHLDKIQTETKYESYLVYENEIILGAFLDIILKIRSLKKTLMASVNMERYSDEKYADFRDVKKIPLIKLFEDSNIVEKKLLSLSYKYQQVFLGVKPRREKPKLTSVFSSKLHYLNAFKIISKSRDLKWNLSGELQLLNIRKLSHLYEAYNLHVIIEFINKNLNITNFEIELSSDRSDGITNKVLFKNSDITIKLFYELKYPDINVSDLIRIDNSIGAYYNPDYILEFVSASSSNYYILDSKYTQYSTLKYNYLNESIFKYILNTGVNSDFFKKIHHLILIYPGERSEEVISSNFYGPQISLVVSKPNFGEDFHVLLRSILEKEVPKDLLLIGQ